MTLVVVDLQLELMTPTVTLELEYFRDTGFSKMYFGMPTSALNKRRALLKQIWDKFQLPVFCNESSERLPPVSKMQC
jgi:hypothetical protein